MNVRPVISRELRVQARQAFTHWLRVLGLLAALGVAGNIVLQRGLVPNEGGELFASLHQTLLACIWVLVPMSVADCVSQEHREGTLGLLLLTPLRPLDIVLAKAVAHALRAFALWLVVLPVMAVAFLQGGIGWREALLSASINFNSLCVAIGVGVLASACCKRWLRALSLATIFSGLAFGLVAVTKSLTVWFFAKLMIPQTSSAPFPGLVDFIQGSWMYFTDSEEIWSEALSTSGIPANTFQAITFGESLSGMVVVSISLGLLWLAGRRVRRSWRDEPPSVRAQQMEKMFCRPVIGVTFLRGWMRRKLARNPIGWLEQRRWSGRLVTWTWFAIIISVETVVLADPYFYRNYTGYQKLMAWLLAGSMTASAAGSFRRERETGVLELLLVSPLTTWQIIGGRLRGLWGQFLPSIVTLLGIWIFFATVFHSEEEGIPGILLFLVTFVAVPVIGLYFSVRCKNFLSAFLLTLALSLVPTATFELLLNVITDFVGFPVAAGFEVAGKGILVMVSFIQLGLAASFLGLLHRKLTTRSFPLQRGAA